MSENRNTKELSIYENMARDKTIRDYRDYHDLNGTDEEVLEYALAAYNRNKDEVIRDFKKRFNKGAILLHASYNTKENEGIMTNKYMSRTEKPWMLTNPETYQLEIWSVDHRKTITKIIDTLRSAMQKCNNKLKTSS